MTSHRSSPFLAATLRVVLAVIVAATAALVSSAVDPAAAYAEPRELDVGYYDSCVAIALADYQTGKSTFNEYHANVAFCCKVADGDWNGEDCLAPPFEQAEAAERQPAPPAVILPDVDPTLFMPPPAGPVGPPPGEATQEP